MSNRLDWSTFGRKRTDIDDGVNGMRNLRSHVQAAEAARAEARLSTACGSQYEDRFRELREAASGDAYAPREASERAFIEFLCAAHNSNHNLVRKSMSERAFIEFLCAAPYRVKRAGLALTGGGDVNAIWVSEDRTTRVSIQVFGDGDVEYVVLWPNSEPELARVSPEAFWWEFSSKLGDVLAA